MLYVCGTCISWDGKRFVAIKKNRPEWQKGLWNLPGGKINMREITNGKDGTNQRLIFIPNETPREAMSREFQEETGVLIKPGTRWICFHIEQYSKVNKEGQKQTNTVYYFVTFGDEINKVKTMTDETITIFEHEDITFAPKEFVFNIPYLYMMLLCQIRNKTLWLLNPGNQNDVA